MKGQTNANAGVLRPDACNTRARVNAKMRSLPISQRAPARRFNCFDLGVDGLGLWRQSLADFGGHVQGGENFCAALENVRYEPCSHRFAFARTTEASADLSIFVLDDKLAMPISHQSLNTRLAARNLHLVRNQRLEIGDRRLEIDLASITTISCARRSPCAHFPRSFNWSKASPPSCCRTDRQMHDTAQDILAQNSLYQNTRRDIRAGASWQGNT